MIHIFEIKYPYFIDLKKKIVLSEFDEIVQAQLRWVFKLHDIFIIACVLLLMFSLTR